MSDRPLITFFVMAYNQERFIREAVEGAISQTYSPLEIILSDDCSTDRTFEIMTEMAEAYKGPHEIILNRNERNLGLVQHVNHVCLGLSHGELVVLAAGDDISVQERVEAIYGAWERTGRKAYAILSGYTHMSLDGGAEETRTFPNEGFVNESVAGYLKRNRPIYGPGCVLACHREVFRTFGPITAAADIEDNTIIVRARLLGEVLLLKQSLVYWRRAGAVSMAKHRDYMWEQEEKFRRQTREQLLLDLSVPSVTVCLSKAEVRKTIRIAKAGIALAQTNDLSARVMGWLRLIPYCSLQETIFNFKLIHRRIMWFAFRRRLGIPIRRCTY